jgi:hypothetical protein
MTDEEEESPPIVLFDDEENPEHCWVETSVTESEARDLVAPFCTDEDGESPFRPVGDAVKQWWRAEVMMGSDSQDDEEWIRVAQGHGREFWAISVY